MNIVNGKGLKSRYWKCLSKTCKNPEREDWDHGLPSEALEYVKERRKKRAQYRKKVREEGKEPGTAMLTRIGWKIGKPENMV
jgi:hypothetical protein